MYVDLLKTKYEIKKLEKWKEGLFKECEKCLLDIGTKKVMVICKSTPFSLGSQITNILCDAETKTEIYELYIKLYDDENSTGKKYILFDLLKVVSIIIAIILVIFSISNLLNKYYLVSLLLICIVFLMPFIPVNIIRSFYKE